MERDPPPPAASSQRPQLQPASNRKGLLPFYPSMMLNAVIKVTIDATAEQLL
ncbi:unnamed protein product [Taenia asiatica]|uniref:Uncharacterized protein n=1 Tax=Taenia asiatica TaxID=60517 RepID=A0A0R3VYF7_TAEAS|nr:unnamed protein product [Taenia asiatica]